MGDDRNGHRIDGRGSVQTARVGWTRDGQPVSEAFDDVYFSRKNGLEESRYVFLEGNDLPERWSALPENAEFIIGETGFGTGLNFLAAWRLWRETAPPSARLHMISVEAFPLAFEDLARALDARTELAPEAQALRDQWPTCLAPGLHHLVFDEGRVRLTLALAEAVDGLDAFLVSEHPLHRSPARGVDAWFLDGFAPAKNPDMWRSELFESVRRLSEPDATLATFTAAGHVRRGLAAAGFDITRTKGFGHKREMLVGSLAEPAHTPSPEKFTDGPYPDGHPHAWHVVANRGGARTARDGHRQSRRAAIVGGGLAGCHAAAALAKRGWDVTLIEAGPSLAQGGSGNDKGVLYARPSAQDGLASDFNVAALLYAQRHYRAFWALGEAYGQACGVLHRARDEAEAVQQRSLVERLGQPHLCAWLDRESAGERAGVDLEAGGLWFPDSGWLSPPAVCASLLDGASVPVQQARITRLERGKDAGWRLLDETDAGVADVDVVVLACAQGLSALEPTETLPVQAVRGQVSSLSASDAGMARQLRIALCADGYVAPARQDSNDALCFGASFVPNDTGTDIRPEEHAENLKRTHASFPGLLPGELSADDLSGRASLRCATPDRLPMVGPVPDRAQMVERFALLRKNANAAISASGAWHEGLYVSAGYGSRGLAYIPLATELLAATISSEPPPVSPHLRVGLNPARFLVRDLKRNRL